MTIKMLAELQSKTNDFMNDLVKQENARMQQQQQNQGGNNNNMVAQRRGRGLNENIEGSESDDGESEE